MSDYTLNLFDSLMAGNAPIGSFTDLFTPTWRRSNRRRGGHYIGTVELTEKQLSKRNLDEIFNFDMLREIREIAGGLESWRGALVKMEYTRDGLLLTRDLSLMANAVAVNYTRIFSNLLTNGSGETGAWTAINSATVAQSTDYVSHGLYSIHITSSGGIRGAYAQATIAITAGLAYNLTGTIHVISGSWRISANRADNDKSLAHTSSKGRTGDLIFTMTIDASNVYTGNVDFRVTSEGSAGEIYCDNFKFTPAEQPASTPWYTDSRSLAVHGRKEAIYLEGGKSNDEAAALAQSYLKRWAWPITQPPRTYTPGAANQPATLKLIFAGYWFALNWIYSTLTGTYDADEAVTRLVALQSQYIVADRIDTNATSITLEERGPLRVGDMLKDIAGSGESGGALYSVGVYSGRRFKYLKVDSELTYSIRGGKLYPRDGAPIEPWRAMPGYALWQDLPMGPGSISSDSKDDPRWVYLEQVEMLPGGQLAFSQDASE